MRPWSTTLIGGWLCLAMGCDTPTFVVLRSPCAASANPVACVGPTGAGANCGVLAADGGCVDPNVQPADCTTVAKAGACDPTTMLITKCADHTQCPKGQLCQKGLGFCAPCTAASCVCPPGTSTNESIVNGCPLCECIGAVCKQHADCGSGALCVKNTCQTCDKAPGGCPTACPFGFKQQVFMRNGCTVCECAPTNECMRDTDCGSNEHCYTGQQCSDGCKDPSCCFGNLCAVPGCQDTSKVSCTRVGCASGHCLDSGKCVTPPVCKCLAPSQSWWCDETCSDAQCVADN